MEAILKGYRGAASLVSESESYSSLEDKLGLNLVLDSFMVTFSLIQHEAERKGIDLEKIFLRRKRKQHPSEPLDPTNEGEDFAEPKAKRRKIPAPRPRPPRPLPEFPSIFQQTHHNYGVGAHIFSRKELLLMSLSATIRRNAKWWRQMDDPAMVARWKQEAQPGAPADVIDYVISELAYYREYRDGAIERSAIDGTWQADGLVPATVRSALIRRVQRLENAQGGQKDWHPGSNNQVRDLVHPSLYCLAFDQTRALAEEPASPACLPLIGQGSVIPAPVLPKNPGPEGAPWTSTRFQWLPSEFDINELGDVQISSYINNLHPIRHKALYSTVAAVFKAMVPMFAKCLTDLSQYTHRLPRLIPRYLRLTDEQKKIYGEPESDDEDDDYAPVNMRVPKKMINRILPDPKKILKLNGRRLQVIVKLANIELTPKNPDYAGGEWHVDGMKNERIVASGIYYYASENITESNLAFRQAVHDPIDIPLYYLESLDFEPHAPMNQHLGQVETKEGRCLVYPNVLQHQVQPFTLADKTKPGFTKFLVFYLVDPNNRIPSTLTVPPQQSSWFADSLRREVPIFSRLPRDVTGLITKFAGWPMDLETAKEHREQTMEVRSDPGPETRTTSPHFFPSGTLRKLRGS